MEERTRHIVSVDSSDMDKALHPHANNYSILKTCCLLFCCLRAHKYNSSSIHRKTITINLSFHHFELKTQLKYCFNLRNLNAQCEL